MVEQVDDGDDNDDTLLKLLKQMMMKFTRNKLMIANL